MSVVKNFQEFVKQTAEQEKDDKEVMHSTLDSLMLDALDELGVDTKSIRALLDMCWYA